MFLMQKEVSAANTVTVKHKTEDQETWLSTTFTTADEFKEMLMENRGRKIKVRFENANPNEDVELNAFQLGYHQYARK
jgi:hypothetical protein